MKSKIRSVIRHAVFVFCCLLALAVLICLVISSTTPATDIEKQDFYMQQCTDYGQYCDLVRVG